MKIIHILNSLYRNGIGTMCENLSISMKKNGDDITIISLHSFKEEKIDKLIKNNIKIIKIEENKYIIEELSSIFDKIKPDIIHVHTPEIMEYAIKANKNSIYNIVRTIHAFDINYNNIPVDGVNYVTLCKTMRDEACRVYKKNEDFYHIACNGININNCIIKDNYKISKEINIICIGYFYEVKNHMELIKAINILKDKYPNIRLKIIGIGALKKQYLRYINKYNLNKYIELPGTITEVYAFLYFSDIFVMPSLSEGLSMSIIEAMATGLPVVASNVGGNKELIENNVNGLLSTAKAVNIAEKIELLINNEDLRERLGKKAQQDSFNYSVEKMRDSYYNIYKIVVLKGSII